MADNPQGISEAEFNRRLGLNVTKADVDRAVAHAFGRGPSRRVEEFESDVQEARTRRIDEQSNAPWRASVWLAEREALLESEERLVGLYSSRRGQSMEAARRTVEASLWEAWANPGGLGLSSDRVDAVVREIQESTQRLAALSPIVKEGRR